ncbi:diguanylate cyclase domain-containing protein [Sphaerotilus mobilis]|uniref:PAS domain S-box-containing protein/diguanylate cyclase (GGDEF)-like protein n=1 Tax=Sphaerotilus mobilis TaxID=47994 RepID=A0A4Q7LVD1_9BURK|nr:diguanylate cyclase [Sphaerotilus mobilis]RZS58277.1 PAS domain S-box-containing protein/diguanylate cyclase (GGDEF)-like protein [Sphaerotilus mobilis]
MALPGTAPAASTPNSRSWTARPFGRAPTSRWPYLLTVALVLALVLGLAAITLHLERERQRERAALATHNIARLLDANLRSLFEQADASLMVVAAREARRPQGESALSPAMRQQVEVASGLRHLRIADAQGRWLAGGEHDASLADGGALARLSQSQTARLLIEGPRRDAPSGIWVLTLMRPVLDTGGRFLGAVVADLPLRRLDRVFDGLALGDHGAATVRTQRMALVYRKPWPDNEDKVIASTEVSRQLRDEMSRPGVDGFYTASTALDGIERVNAWRRVPGLPLVVIVGLAVDDFEADWQRQLTLVGLLAGVAVLTVAVLVWLLYRASKRRIGAAEQRFEAIVQFSRDAIISKSLDSRVTSWNAGAEAALGWREDEMVGHSISRVLPADRQQEEVDLMARIVRGEVVEAFDTVRLHRDGHRVDMSVSVAPLYDDHGRVIGASSIGRDVTRQKAMEEEIRSLAFLDPLTRLPNRRLLLDRLNQALVRARRDRCHGALVFIDLDHFKDLNDTHGHEMGDRVLVETAQRLSAHVRLSDTVARLGGDEFVVVCPDLGADPETALRDVQNLMVKLDHALSQPLAIGDLQHGILASLGWRVFGPQDHDPDEVLKDADQAMYAQKASHRAHENAVNESLFDRSI